MASTVIYQKRGDDKVKIMETPDLSPYAIKADVDAELSTKADAEDLAVTDKRVDNLAALLNGTLYREETDSTEAYSKAVPSSAMPWASVDMIGGKTVAWNQLARVDLALDTYTTSNITFTKNSDGSVTVNGNTNDASSAIFFFMARNNSSVGNVRFTATHKYLLTGAPAGSGSSTYYIASLNFTDLGSGNIFTIANTTTTGQCYIRIAPNVTVSNLVFRPRIVDLTLMFGPGNEPSTVAEFEAMFPTIDPAYNAGELRSAGVTEAVSESKNLAFFGNGQGTPSNTASPNSTKRIFERGYYYVGMSYDNYYVPANISGLTINDTGTISFTSSLAGYGIGVPFPVEPNASYTASLTNLVSGGAYRIAIDWYANDGTYLSNSLAVSQSVTGTAPRNAAFALIAVVAQGTSLSLSFSNLQVERGSTQTAYVVPRAPVSLPIPAAVQQLPGYGWSAGTAYNVVSLAQGKNTQNVGICTLNGTQRVLASRFNNGTGFVQYRLTAIGLLDGKVDGGILCTYYPAYDASASPAQLDSIRLYYEGGYIRVLIRDARFNDGGSITSLDQWNAWLASTPLTFYYELATPIETDISQYLTDDNLINVEAGGTVSFPSQLGDDFRLPVPNEETFLVQATPELPTTDGTYTLQCTVTDGTPAVTWVTA